MNPPQLGMSVLDIYQKGFGGWIALRRTPDPRLHRASNIDASVELWMMRRFFFIGILAGLLSVAATGAHAQQSSNLTVPAGATSTLLSVPFWDGRCQFGGYPDILVQEQPSHGRVRVQRASRLQVPANGGACAGKVVKGTVLLYTPNRGYRGRDSVSFSVYIFDNSTGRRKFVGGTTTNITVR
jgi:hypothetical protein